MFVCRAAKAPAAILESDSAAVFEVAIRFSEHCELAAGRGREPPAPVVDPDAEKFGATLVPWQQKQAKLSGPACAEPTAVPCAALVWSHLFPPLEPVAYKHCESVVSSVLAVGKLLDLKFKLEENTSLAQILPTRVNSKVNWWRQQLFC